MATRIRLVETPHGLTPSRTAASKALKLLGMCPAPLVRLELGTIIMRHTRAWYERNGSSRVLKVAFLYNPTERNYKYTANILAVETMGTHPTGDVFFPERKDMSEALPEALASLFKRALQNKKFGLDLDALCSSLTPDKDEEVTYEDYYVWD